MTTEALPPVHSATGRAQSAPSGASHLGSGGNIRASAISLVAFVFGLWLLEGAISGGHVGRAFGYVGQLSLPALAAAVLFTAASYCAVVGRDFFALHHLGGRAPLRTVAATSLISTALAHNLGLGGATAPSPRTRLYADTGLTGFDIWRFHLVAFGLGALLTAGIAFLAAPGALAGHTALPSAFVRGLGAVLTLPAATVLALGTFGVGHAAILRSRIRVPHPGVSAGHLAATFAGLTAAAAALFVLLPEQHGISFFAFLGIFLLAAAAAAVSRVPGGLGVFEGLILALTPIAVPVHELLGALVAFRAVYYLAPLAVAVAGLGVADKVAQSDGIDGGNHLFQLAPMLAAAAAFMAAAVLLATDVVPDHAQSLVMVGARVPGGALDAAHLVADLAGFGLVSVVGGLLRRVHLAFISTVALLLLGSLASLTRDAGYHEAGILLTLAALLWATHRAFFRPAALTAPQRSPQWLGAFAALATGAIALGALAYRHVELGTALWWQVQPNVDASRALFLAALTAVAVGAHLLLQPAVHRPPPPTATDLMRAAAVVARSSDTAANLALLGDKSLLFSANGEAFIMYRVRGSTWVAMGNPVGSPAAAGEVLRRFRDLCEQSGANCAFYRVDGSYLNAYRALGLASHKIGDVARVDLRQFSLDVPGRGGLRQNYRRATRAGATFRILAPGEVAAVLPRLREISDQWLASKKSREKAFSLGNFDERYLSRFPCAVVFLGGEIVAFANLWIGAGGEISVDLMRHVHPPLHGLMDFLFVETLLWAKAQGFATFDLGMAPLSGLEDQRHGHLWNGRRYRPRAARGPVLPVPRPPPLQGQVRPGLGAALPRLPRWPHGRACVD